MIVENDKSQNSIGVPEKHANKIRISMKSQEYFSINVRLWKNIRVVCRQQIFSQFSWKGWKNQENASKSIDSMRNAGQIRRLFENSDSLKRIVFELSKIHGKHCF